MSPWDIQRFVDCLKVGIIIIIIYLAFKSRQMTGMIYQVIRRWNFWFWILLLFLILQPRYFGDLAFH